MDWSSLFATRVARMKASEIRELLKLLDQPDVISFAGGIPDSHQFPAEAIKDAYARVLTGDSADVALQYSVSEGYAPLREWIVKQMASLGVTCDIENVFITSGSQQGLDYLGKLFLSPNDTALVSWPTYLGALGAFNGYEPTYDHMPLHGEVDAATLAKRAAEKGGKVKFAYALSEFHNPTGETMTKDERNALLDLAEELDTAVIEDSAYQALRYDGDFIPPVLALDLARHNGDINAVRTFYCGSFSKTLAPGLRIGWIVGPKDMISKLVLIKQAADLHTSTINQMVVTEVVTALFDDQVKKIRKAYAHRRDCMLTALETYMPEGVTWTRPQGGMFIWVTLPQGFDSAALLAEALKEEKVAFVPGKAFFADGTGENTLRISFSCADDAMIDEGIKRMGRLITSKL